MCPAKLQQKSFVLWGVVKICLQSQAVNLSSVVTASQELGSEAEPAHVTETGRS